MRSWQILENGELKLVDQNVREILNYNDVKIKITKCLITKKDISFSHNFSKNLPITIGSKAVGLVIESSKENVFFQKNDKVYIKPQRPCYECKECLNGNIKNCINPKFAGEDYNGYLRDFCVKSNDDIIKLPERINDYDALFISLIASSLSIMDSLNLEKGDTVCIVGKSITTLILAQLLIYYQYVPIIISDSKKFNDLANQCGIYYVLNSKKDITKSIIEITGNKKIYKLVYSNLSDTSSKIIENIAGYKAIVVFTGTINTNIRLDCKSLLEKQMTVIFNRENKYKYDTAINILTKNILNLSVFNLDEIKIDNIGEHLQNLKKETDLDFGFIANMTSL